jgi:hypothetical protein
MLNLNQNRRLKTLELFLLSDLHFAINSRATLLKTYGLVESPKGNTKNLKYRTTPFLSGQENPKNLVCCEKYL